MTRDQRAAADAEGVIRVRPVVAGRIAVVAAVVVFALFVAISLVMTRENAGVDFHLSDRVATAAIGVFAGTGLLLLGRPRLVADQEGLRSKAWAGDARFIPWDLVLDVQFPAGRRFARVTLPGEEYLSLYAVQRLDGDRAAVTMDRLRTLHARVRADLAGPGPGPGPGPT